MITNLYEYGSDISPTVYGGKAYGLSFLARQYGTNVVPAAWGLACEYSLTRPNIDKALEKLINVYTPSHRWAVRSGAPTSMPGLMSTLLDVPNTLEALRDAVTKVWDSWNSPEAMAYREEHNISNTGTGVVIQTFIEPDYAGVAFTTDPNNPAVGYLPVVEYVSGDGEKLVNGSTAPTQLCGAAEILSCEIAPIRRMSDYLNDIHVNTGHPADIEWCVKGSQLYLLQYRKLKPPAAAVSTSALTDGDLQVGLGVSIGGAVTNIGYLYYATPQSKVENFKAPYILAMSQFAPALYPLMLKSAGILTKTGGATCHAAIIGRELGIPALSGYKLTGSIPDGTVVKLDGANGKVYQTADEPPEAGKALQKKCKADTSRTPIVEKLTPGKFKFQADSLALRVYVNYARMMQGELPKEVFDKVCNDAALVVATYSYLACLGELRHCYNKVSKSLTVVTVSGKKVGQASELLDKFGAEMLKLGITIGPKIGPNYTGDRGDFIGRVPKLKLVEAIRVMQLTAKIYSLPWSGAYGGVRWKQITLLVLSYLRNEISSFLFLDQVFNIRHNGGRVFGKVPWLIEVGYLQAVLDNKQIQKTPKGLLAELAQFVADHKCTVDPGVDIWEIGAPWGDSIVFTLSSVPTSGALVPEDLINKPEPPKVETPKPAPKPAAVTASFTSDFPPLKWDYFNYWENQAHESAPTNG